ncbi:MAG: alpha-isopropylmalate synthase regulatory domain-containing protein [Cyanobacteria bacterium J06635_15]
MNIQSILVDGNLLWDVLLKRYGSMESMGFIWKLISLGGLKGYVTDVSIEEIWRNAYRLKGREIADKLVYSLLKVLECIPVERSVIRKACSLNLRFAAAVNVLCGLELQVDGILTSNPLDFCQSEFQGMSILTPDLFIFKHLERSFGDLSVNKTSCAVTREEDRVLVAAGGRQYGQSVWCLEQLKVCCGVKEPSATVVVQTAESETLRATATGNGPIDAAYKAIKKSFEQCAVPEHQLVYTSTQATTADSEVSVMILLQAGDSLFPGRGFHTDTVWAYVLAYIDAVDYMICCLPR